MQADFLNVLRREGVNMPHVLISNVSVSSWWRNTSYFFPHIRTKFKNLYRNCDAQGTTME